MHLLWIVFSFWFAANNAGGQAHYRKHGSVLLNDLTYTPGATDGMTAKQLCNAKFHTITVRNVSDKEKNLVCAEYGIPRRKCNGKVEIDHAISLEIGGSNDVANLWPQPYSPVPGARQKDVLENRLHKMVCEGSISLEDAQKAIRTDWYAEYLKLGLDKE